MKVVFWESQSVFLQVYTTNQLFIDMSAQKAQEYTKKH